MVTQPNVPTAAARARDRQPDHEPARAGLRLDERVALLRDRLEARADARAVAQLREEVKEARGFMKGFNARDVSADTAARYSRAVNQMRSAGQRPEDAASKATFHFQRAAFVYVTRNEVKAGLRDLDRHRRAGDVDRAADAYTRVRDGLDALRRYPPSTGNRAADMQRQSVYNGPSRAEHSNGKRDSLTGLPDDWRDRVQREVGDADRPAVAAMALSGARPVELKGIRVQQDGQDVSLTIRGAKTDSNRGVESRTITFDRDELVNTEAGRDILGWLGNREQRTVTHGGSVGSFRERVARAGDRAGLPAVTAYSYRHAEARRLRNADTPRGEIASRLGHRDERSQRQYG